MGEMSKVEEVARALAENLEKYGFEPYEVHEANGTVGYLHEEAKRLIEAMRKPTEAMLEAGFHEIKPDGLPADKGDAGACFAVMIDTALKE